MQWLNVKLTQFRGTNMKELEVQWHKRMTFEVYCNSQYQKRANHTYMNCLNWPGCASFKLYECCNDRHAREPKSSRRSEVLRRP